MKLKRNCLTFLIVSMLITSFCYFDVNIVSRAGANPSYEDFKPPPPQYTEVDPNSHIDIPSDYFCDVNGMIRDESCYLYDDKGAEHFTDFDHKLDVKCVGIDGGGEGIFWALTNDVGNRSAWGTHIRVQFYHTGTYQRLYIQASGGNDIYQDFTVGMEYFLVINRVGTDLTCILYATDANRTADTNRIDTLTTTCGVDEKYRYIYAVASKGDAYSYAVSLDVKNLDLQEAEDETPPTYQNIGSNSSSIEQGGTILLYGQGKDETALDWAWLSTNETGNWYNYTTPDQDFASGFTTINSFDANATQGIATDGTYIWTTGGPASDPNHNIYKFDKSGNMLLHHPNAHLDGIDMTQVNHIYYEDDKLYVGSNNYSNATKRGYIKIFNASTLAFIEEHQVENYWSEGCAWYDNHWWAIYSEPVITKYDSSWNYVATYDSPYPTGEYNGIAWIGDYAYCTNHENGAVPVDVLYWNGTGFEGMGQLDPPTVRCTQGIHCDPMNSDVLWFAERYHAGGSEHHALNATINGISEGYYDSPMDMEDVADSWAWSNFTWCNTSIASGTTIQWKICYNDTSGNENCTSIHSFSVGEDEAETLFYDGFETGDFSLWDLGGDYPYADHDIQSTIKYNGTYASWMNGTASDHHRCEKNVTLTTETLIHLQFYVRIDEAPTGPANGFVYLAGLGDTTPTAEVMLCLNTTSMNFGLQTEHNVTSYTESSMTASLQVWYLIDIYVKVEDCVYLFVDGTQEVCRSDSESLSMISNVVMIYSIGKGLGWSGNHVVYHDDVLLDDVLFEEEVGPVGPFGSHDHRVEINVRLNGERLKGANVTVEGGPDNKLKWGLTDVFGRYIFKLKTGSYEVVATYEEYRETKLVYVSRHMTVSIDFTKEDIISPDVLPEDVKDFFEDVLTWVKLPEIDFTTETFLVFILPLVVLVVYAIKKASEGPKKKWKYGYLD